MPVETKTADPNVKLPAAVMRAAARATELSNELRGTGNIAIADVHSSMPPIAPTPSHTQTSVRTPAPALALAPASASTTQSNVRENEGSGVTFSEQQYKSMQGRWERSQRENQDLINRLNESQRLIAYLNISQSQPQPQPQNTQVGRGDTRFNVPISPAVQRLITEKEKSEYGEELIDIIGRRAREILEPEIQALRAENQQLRQTVGGVQQANAVDLNARFYQELSKEIPDWEEIQATPEWGDWINRIEPMTGSTRKAILEDSYNRRSSTRAIDAFKMFKAEQAASSPVQEHRSRPGNGADNSGSSSGNANTNYSRSNSATTPAVDLASFAAPGRARSGQAPTTPDKPIILGSEITAFYKDVTHGRYRGRENEQRDIERQIEEALREGRIVKGR